MVFDATRTGLGRAPQGESSMSARKEILIGARRSLIALTVVLIATGGVFFGAQYLADQVKNQILQLQQQQAQNEITLKQKLIDATSLREGMDNFETLRKQGLVGLPAREAWVEQLIASRAKMGLPSTLTYTLQPPKPLKQQDAQALPATVEPGSIAEATDGPLLHDLEFKISAIHEDELLALLRDYQSHVMGRFRVNACTLATPLENGLSASCTLRFFTLPDPRDLPPNSSKSVLAPKQG